MAHLVGINKLEEKQNEPQFANVQPPVSDSVLTALVDRIFTEFIGLKSELQNMHHHSDATVKQKGDILEIIKKGL